MAYRISDKLKVWHGEPGQLVYAIRTGPIRKERSSCRAAVRYIRRQRGLLTRAGNDSVALWFFDSLKNAVKARENMTAVQIKTDKKIGEFVVNMKNSIDYVREVTELEIKEVAPVQQ